MKTLLTALLLLGASAAASSAELYYFFDHKCGACQKFDREVGGHYSLTQEGQQAPIKKVEFQEWRQLEPKPYADVLAKPVFATPTFVMVHEGKEIERLTGYSNDELFWLAMQHMLYRVEHIADGE